MATTTTQSVQINCYVNKPNSVNGKFAPTEMVVYKMPTINECMKLLPRDIGNHILSFTNAWLEWYLENIRKKYGDKFTLDMLVNMLKTKHQMNFRCRKLNEIIDFIIRKMGMKISWGSDILKRDDVRFAFEDQLVIHSASIGLKRELKINKQQEYEVWFNTLQVGDILDLPNYHLTKLVISKTDKSYKYIYIRVDYHSINCWKINQSIYRNIHTIHIGRIVWSMLERRPIKLITPNGDIELDLENPISQINQYY
jgi:hypothetical protein